MQAKQLTNIDLLSQLGASANKSVTGKSKDSTNAEFEALLAGVGKETEGKKSADLELLQLLNKGENSKSKEGKEISETEQESVSVELLSTLGKEKNKEGFSQIGNKINVQSHQDVKNININSPNLGLSEKQKIQTSSNEMKSIIPIEEIEAKIPQALNKLEINSKGVGSKQNLVTDLQDGNEVIKMVQMNRNKALMMNNGAPQIVKLAKPSIHSYRNNANVLDSNLIKIPQLDKLPVEVSNEAVSALPTDALNMEALLNESKTSSSDGGNESFLKGNKGILDLGQVKVQNSQQLINKISTYIEQSYLENKDSMDLLVRHNELGEFRVTADKATQRDMVNLKIEAMTQEGKNFFVQHETDLIKSLNKTGVKLADFKILSNEGTFASLSSSNSDSKGQSFSQSFGGQESGRHAENQGRNSGQQDSDRRRQLWQQFQGQNEWQQSYA